MPRLNLPKEQTFTAPALIWKRILAFIIDMLIINLFIFMPFRSLFSDILPETYGFMEAYASLSSESLGQITTIAFVMGLFAMLYFVFMEKKMGQTIGKYLLKIRVEGNEKETKTWQFYLRSIFFIPVFPLILLWAADPIAMLFTKSNQRLSEIISKTKTVETFELKKEW